MRHLVIALWRALATYLRADRIRISPLEGQIARLAPGSVIVYAGEPFRIQRRKRAQHRGRPCLEFTCRGRRSTRVLRLFGEDRKKTVAAQWILADGPVPCCVDQLEVYASEGPGIHLG